MEMDALFTLIMSRWVVEEIGVTGETAFPSLSPDSGSSHPSKERKTASMALFFFALVTHQSITAGLIDRPRIRSIVGEMVGSRATLRLITREAHSKPIV